MYGAESSKKKCRFTFFGNTLNGEKFLDFLNFILLPLLPPLSDVALEIRTNMWFQLDCCPAHRNI